MKTLLVAIAIVMSGCSPQAASMVGAFAEGANRGLQTDYHHSDYHPDTGGRYFTISRMGYMQTCYQDAAGNITCF